MIIISVTFWIVECLQIDNEENVMVCLRVIIELHKQYRPQINTDVSLMSCLQVVHLDANYTV